MKEWLELGPVPSDEVCEQVGLSEYNPDKARKEVLVYQKQLETQFKDKLNLVKFGVKLFQHDFGPYYEVVVYYNSEDQEAVDAAFEIESSLPKNWTQESLIELSKKDNPCGTRKKKNPIEKNGKLLAALEKINETLSLSPAEKQVLSVLVEFLRKQEKPNGKVIIKDNRRSL